MNFTVFIFLTAIVLFVLWLSAKFLGKTGLYLFAGVCFLLCGYLSIAKEGWAIVFLSAFIEIPVAIFVPTLFVICLMYKKYGLSEGLKFVTVLAIMSLFVTTANFVVDLYERATFSMALQTSFLPFIISIFSLACALGVGFVISEHTKFLTKYNESFKNFVIFCIMLFVNTFLFTMLGEINYFGFGQMLLNTLMTYLWQVIIAGIIFLLPSKLLTINDNLNFGDKIKEKLEKAVASAKKSIEKIEEKTEPEITTESEDSETEIIIEDNKD